MKKVSVRLAAVVVGAAMWWQQAATASAVEAKAGAGQESAGAVQPPTVPPTRAVSDGGKDPFKVSQPGGRVSPAVPAVASAPPTLVKATYSESGQRSISVHMAEFLVPMDKSSDLFRLGATNGASAYRTVKSVYPLNRSMTLTLLPEQEGALSVSSEETGSYTMYAVVSWETENTVIVNYRFVREDAKTERSSVQTMLTTRLTLNEPTPVAGMPAASSGGTKQDAATSLCAITFLTAATGEPPRVPEAIRIAKEMVLKEVASESADIVDLVTWLVGEARASQPNKTVNIVVAPEVQGKKVTMSARSITLYDTLKMIGELTGTEVVAKGDNVISLQPKQEAPRFVRPGIAAP